MVTAAKEPAQKAQTKRKIEREPMTPFLHLRAELAQREYDAGLAIPAELGWEMLKKLDRGAA